MKELVIIDLSKKHVETGARLREFSKLYDIVKADRNKYVNQISASAQALAEMKEKTKILQNEVEILRNESVAKDKALSRERLEHQNAFYARDSIRAEQNKHAAAERVKAAQAATAADERHLMLSYCWAQQEIVLQIREELGLRGYKVWLDVEQMAGSTVDAMAEAIDLSFAVCFGISRDYVRP